VGSQKAAGGGARPIVEALASVPDPRSGHGRRHPLCAVLTLAVRAMMCGRRNLYGTAQWARDHRGEMALAVGFTRDRTPRVATLHAMFSRRDREAFERALGTWFQDAGQERGEALAVDGKTLRGIHGEALPGVRLVAAHAHRTCTEPLSRWWRGSRLRVARARSWPR